MAETVYTPLKRKPLPPGAAAQLPPRPGDALLGDDKLRHSTASTAVLRGESGYAIAPKTVISVHFLRLATIAFTFTSLSSAAWIMYFTHMSVDKWTQSIAIGGSFSQPQAKIIDFLASAIAAPMIIAAFNYVSFQIARASVLDTEVVTSTFTVKALVEVGTTTFGSYDPFKLATLFATSKLRFMLLAVAAILSAVSFSTLTNVIAYEAFQASANDQSSVRLDYLYSPPGQSVTQKSENEGVVTNQMPAISSEDLLSDFTAQYFEVMTALSFTTAERFLDDGKYIGINATNASLSAVPSNIDKLFDVPAYQLSYTCVPALAQNIHFLIVGEVNDILTITLDLDIPNSQPNITFEAYMMNGDSSVMGGFLSAATFVAFDTLAAATKTFYLGVFSDSLVAADSLFSFSNLTIESSFGPLENTIFNNTAVGGYPYTNMYGVACGVHYHVGTVNLSRKSNSSTWTRSSGEFGTDHNELSLIMPDLQLFPNFVGPVSNVMPGIGGGLAASTNVVSVANLLNKTNNFEDFGSFAMNYLYAEGESRRIAYEVAQSALGHGGISYGVQAMDTMLKYQIMFVPWILLVGLLTMAFAGICVLLLILLAHGSIGSRAGRVVSPLRLMVDAVAGLSREEFTAVSTFEEAKLEKWSKRFEVQYNTLNEDGRMKLQSVGSVRWALQEED